MSLSFCLRRAVEVCIAGTFLASSGVASHDRRDEEVVSVREASYPSPNVLRRCSDGLRRILPDLSCVVVWSILYAHEET